MKRTLSTLTLLLVALALAVPEPALAQEEMTKDQWQAEMSRLTARKAELTTQMTKLDADIAAMKAQADKASADATACEDALYAMLGVTRGDVEAFDRELGTMESRVAELQRMSDAELLTHRDEIVAMDARLAEMAKSKIALIPRYGNRISALQAKVAALMKSLQREKMYTVGTWSRDRDCLWNIAKKPDMYNNAWLWPKIWQGNRDMIRDPDVIQPGWNLKIPEGNELSREEQSAANRYYRSKSAAEPGSIP
jgi:nucleoid-associated protein YgaU